MAEVHLPLSEQERQDCRMQVSCPGVVHVTGLKRYISDRSGLLRIKEMYEIRWYRGIFALYIM